MKGKNLAALAFYSTLAVIYLEKSIRSVSRVRWRGP